MKNLVKIFFILLASTLASAHVGSPDVYYEGDAGPYHLYVTVRMPQVVPGIAELQVRSASPDVESVHVVMLRLTGAGSKYPPVPENAARSTDDPQFFVSKLWLMQFGGMQVRIEAYGPKGKGEVSVPIASFARGSLPMNSGLRSLAAFFLIFLSLGAVAIIGGIVRESTVAPGETLVAGNRLRSRLVMAAVLAGVLGVGYLNHTWWQSADNTYNYAVNLLKPPPAETKLLDGNRLLIRPATQLKVPVAGAGLRADEVKMSELLPDHGHLMHLFLIRMPAMDRMWHLHPDRAEGGAFAEKLPPVPEGQYQVYADIVDKNGFPWTLVGNLKLPNITGTTSVGDDSGWEGAGLTAPVTETIVAQLPDGSRILWERDDSSLKANVPASLKFRVENKDGSPASDMEPYMGMVAHAEVVCTDLSVFAHLHPNGSISMAAFDIAQAGLAPGSGASDKSMNMMHHAGPLSPEFSFPYGFPHPGDYRVFVQIKRSGKVQTAVFDAHVQ
jgi:hypothetical protein